MNAAVKTWTVSDPGRPETAVEGAPNPGRSHCAMTKPTEERSRSRHGEATTLPALTAARTA